MCPDGVTHKMRGATDKSMCTSNYVYICTVDCHRSVISGDDNRPPIIRMYCS